MLLAVAGALARPALALDPARAITQYAHKAWQTVDGLPQNSIHAIAQTPDGYLWIGTEEGLVRFDGVAFTVFDRSNSPGLKSNVVDALLADRHGNLWIGTEGGGLSVFASGKLTAWAQPLDDVVWVLYEDREGNIWIGTNAGLRRLGPNGQLVAYTRREGLSNEFVTAIHQDAKGTLWVGTSGGLNRLDGTRLTAYTTRDGLASQRIAAISEDREGNLWVGTYGGGLSRLRDGRFTTYTPLGNALVHATHVDRDGNVWVGTRGGGLQRFRDGKFTAFTSRHGLSGDIVRRIFEDREGNLWLGTFGAGLNRLTDGKVVPFGSPEGLPGDWVNAVTEGPPGVLWIGTEGGGLSRLEAGRLTRFTATEGLPNDTVTSLWSDQRGRLWAGTIGGLGRLEGGKFSVYGTPEGLSDERVFAVFEDRAGVLWVGTRDGHLNRLLPNGRFATHTLPRQNTGVQCIAQDIQGRLWLGTLGAGLCRLDGDRFTCYGAEQGVPSIVLSLLADRDGRLWIGTSGGGLLTLEDGQFKVYTTKQGLFNDTVFSILDDDRGNLWMSCNKGVFRVGRKQFSDLAEGRRSSLSCVSYGAADGMRSAESVGGYQTSAWKGRDGRLYFATLKGVAMVDPARISTRALPPPVMVERVVADGVPLPRSPTVEVGAGTRSIEFHYAALTLAAPEKVRFSYQLEGFDAGMIEAGTRRVAYYTNVPPGEFRFHVLASNSDGAWNDASAALGVYLRPRFHQTGLFFALCVLAAASGAWGLHRVRLRSLRLRNAVLTERNRLAQEIHDEISQIMTGVLHQLDAALETAGTDASRSYIARATELAQRGIGEARRMIRGLQAPAGEEADLADALRRALAPLTEGTAVEVAVGERGRTTRLPPEVKGELFRIGQEAVTNAIRHGHARQIEIALGYEPGGVRLAIHDDGRGFVPEEVLRRPKGGLGLSGIWRRVASRHGSLNIKTRPGGGTTVEVFVPRRSGRPGPP